LSDVFISYSRRDGALVARLVEALQARGKDVWVDVGGIRDAEVFPAALRMAVEQSDGFLFVISPESVASRYCEQEVTHALELNKRIVPLLYRAVPDDALPEGIRVRNWIPIGDDGDFEQTVARAVDALDTDLAWTKEHTRWLVKALEWDGEGRERSFLLRGSELAAAEAWLASGAGKEPQPTALQSEYVAASRIAVTRRQRLTVTVSVAVAAVSLALLTFALITRSQAISARNNARKAQAAAEAQALRSESREAAAQHPDLGLLLALEADRLDDSVASRSALLGALEHGGRIHRMLQGFDSPVNAAAFSPDGKLLATTTQDGTTLWDTDTWRPVGPPLRSAQERWSWVDFSPDGRTLAIAGGQGRVELWDVSTRNELGELTDPAAASSEDPALASVHFSPDGKVIAAGAQETNHVTLWAVASRRVIGRPITTKPAGSGAHSISFSPDSKLIAAPGAPGKVGIWKVATGRRVGEPLAIGTEDAGAAIFTAGGRTLIAGDDSGSVSIIDIATGRPTRPPLSVGDTPVSSLDLSPDGRLLAAASVAGSVVVWDVKTGAPYGSPLTADTSLVSHVVFSPDGRTLVSSHVRSVVVWNMSGEQAIGQPIDGPRDLTTDVAFSPDGRRLAAGRVDGGTVVYDTATRRQALRIDGGSLVTAVEFHPGRNVIAVGTIDGRVRLFDGESGTAVGSLLDGGRSAVWQLAFSPDGRLLAVAVDPNGVDGFYTQQRQGEVQLWDVDSRRRVGRAIAPRAGSVLSVAFNHDGTLLATGSYRGQLDLWDVATHARHGKPMTVKDDGFLSVAFDATGRLVAGGVALGPVRVWRVADQRPAFPPLSGPTGFVTGTAFDMAGSFLATTSHLGATRLWEPTTGRGYGGELVASPKPDSLLPSGEPPPFLAMGNAFSPDGKLLAVAGVDTRAMLWDLDPAVWRRRACAIVGRNLTREEWNLHLPPGTPYRATCSEWPTP
jgi:WD40 repeat protein